MNSVGPSEVARGAHPPRKLFGLPSASVPGSGPSHAGRCSGPAGSPPSSLSEEENNEAGEKRPSLYCEKLPSCNTLSFRGGRSQAGPGTPRSAPGRSCGPSRFWCCPAHPPHRTVVPAQETTAQPPRSDNMHPPTRGLPGHPWRRRLGLAKEKSGFALLPNPGCQHLPTTLVPASSKAKPFGAWRGASRSCDSTLISHPARVLLSVCGSAPPLVPAKLL